MTSWNPSSVSMYIRERGGTCASMRHHHHQQQQHKIECHEDEDDEVPLLVPIRGEWGSGAGRMGWIKEKDFDRCLNFLASILSCRRCFTAVLMVLCLPAFSWIFFSTSETVVTSLLSEEPPPDQYEECHTQMPGKIRFPVFKGEQSNSEEVLKPLIVITPTYMRPEQTAELTRMAQTLSLADQDLHWILVEDDKTCNDRVKKILNRFFGLSNEKRNPHVTFTHLASPMPLMFREKKRIKRYGEPRGVAGRRAALKWLLERSSPSDSVVVYFADDDNTYDVRLFNEIRKTKKLSMFPVGLLSPHGISSPLLNHHKRVIGFAGTKRPYRKFPIDMAGFAFSLSLVHEKKPEMPYRATYEEEGFLLSMGISYLDIEPLAADCTEIMAWHTVTAAPRGMIYKLPQDEGLVNIMGLFKSMVASGLAMMDEELGNTLPMCIGAECVQ